LVSGAISLGIDRAEAGMLIRHWCLMRALSTGTTVERRRYGSVALDAGQRSELSLARVDICRYHRCMPDVLIRDLSAEDLARLDAHAARQGLSRTEYLRRRLREDAARVDAPVAVSDLERFAERFGDLEDPEVMRQAWS
jgi:hypothetical protein